MVIETPDGVFYAFFQKENKMKYLSDYTEDAISETMKKHGAFYAFSTSQFNENKVEGVTYIQTGSGMLVPKENIKVLIEEMNKIYEDGIKQDMAENGLVAIIKRELSNYECYYSGEIEDAVDALKEYGITYEQVENVYKGLPC